MTLTNELKNSNGGTLSRKSSGQTHGTFVYETNIAILGPLGVGKSALTVKYLTKRFITEYDPEMEDVFTRIDTLDNQEIVVNIMDTCDEVFKKPERYLEWADAFAVVYSLTSRNSFMEAHSYLEDLTAFKTKIGNESIPLFLIANKLDLERYRQVGTHEGGICAAKFNAYFLETSAAEDCDEVTKCFHQALRMILHEQERTKRFRTLFIADDNPSKSTLLECGVLVPKMLLRIPAPESDKHRHHRQDDKIFQLIDRSPKFKLFSKNFKIFRE